MKRLWQWLLMWMAGDAPWECPLWPEDGPK